MLLLLLRDSQLVFYLLGWQMGEMQQQLVWDMIRFRWLEQQQQQQQRLSHTEGLRDDPAGQPIYSNSVARWSLLLLYQMLCLQIECINTLDTCKHTRLQTDVLRLGYDAQRDDDNNYTQLISSSLISLIELHWQTANCCYQDHVLTKSQIAHEKFTFDKNIYNNNTNCR